MALHFPLMVNDEPIGRFVAQRREPAIPADRICTYDVTVTLRGSTRTAVVRHNYDAGAYGLVAAGLAAVNQMMVGPADLEPYVVHRGKVRTLYRVPPPPMPVFPILAKDLLAVDAVAAYQALCLKHGRDRQAAQVQLALDEMDAWQAAHPDLVKWPDHDHVPAVELAAATLPAGRHCPSCDGHSCPDVG